MVLRIAKDGEQLMTGYSFSVSESRHAELIGETFRRTRMLRRALLHKLTGQEFSEMPAEALTEMSVQELMKELHVVEQGSRLVVTVGEAAGALRRDAHSRRDAHMHPGGFGRGSRSHKAKDEGRPLAGAIYGYQRTARGRYLPDPEMAAVLRQAYEIATEAGYSEAGRYLNLMRVPTPTGLLWDKDAARASLRNPIYAGYQREYLAELRSGPMAFYPAWRVEALVNLQEWMAANHSYVQARVIQFPKGFLTPGDQRAWQNWNAYAALEGAVQGEEKVVK